jgi:hypothetical protein
MVSCLRWIENPDGDNETNSKNMLNISLSGSPGAVIYQNYYKGCYKRKTTTHVIQWYKNTKPQINMMLFDHKWAQASNGVIM